MKVEPCETIEVDGFRLSCNVGKLGVSDLVAGTYFDGKPGILTWYPPKEKVNDPSLFKVPTVFFAGNRNGWRDAVERLSNAMQHGSQGHCTEAGNEYMKTVVVTIEEVA